MAMRGLFALALVMSAVTRSEPHTALGAAVEINVPLNPRYPGKDGVATLVDGVIAETSYGGGVALGFEGLDVEITVRLEEPTQIRTIAADFLQITPPAIYLPVSVDFAVSENGTNFRTVATVAPKATAKDAGPLHERIQATGLDVKAHAVRVRVANGGRVPSDHRSPQALRWTFISEVLVNPGDKPKSIWDALRAYQFGASRTCLTRVERLLRTSDAEERKAILKALRELLTDKDATTDAKGFACELLALHGDAADVPALATALGEDGLLEPAASALASIGGPEAEKTLLTALPKAADKGVLVNALASFRSPATAQALAALLGDAELGPLAARSLAAVGDPTAVAALSEALDKATAAQRQWLGEALLVAAGREALPAETRTEALSLVMAQGASITQLAAAGALLRYQDHAPALASLLQATRGDVASQRTQAATLLGALVEQNGIARLSPGFKSLPSPVRCALVRRERQLEWLMAHTDLPETDVRHAVLLRLGEIGNEDAVPALCQRLAVNTDQDTATQALAGLRGAAADAALLAVAVGAIDTARPALAKVFGQRKQKSAGAIVLSWLQDNSLPARDGWQILGEIAGPELLAPLADELARRPDQRRAIGKALLHAGKDAGPDQSAPLVRQLSKATAPDEREILVQGLAALGDPNALRHSLADPATEVRLAAIRGLGECGNAPDLAPLLVAADTSDTRQNVLALRAALTVLTNKVDPATGPDASDLLASAWQHARRDEERQQIIALAGQRREAGSLAFLADPNLPANLRPAAAAACIAVAENAWPDSPAQAAATLRQVVPDTQDEKLKARAQVVLDRIAAFQPFLARLDERPWQPAFNGKDLSGWQPVNGKKDSWTVTDGLLVANSGGGGWLARAEEMSDYLFELEFCLPAGGNSGFFLRPPLKGNPAWEGIEVQMLDDAAPQYAGKLRADQYCASIYGMGPAQPGVIRPAGQWQKLRVLCAGRHVAVWLNGEPVSYTALDEHMDKADKIHGLKRTSGFPGLQNEHGPIQFRNLRFRDLK